MKISLARLVGWGAGPVELLFGNGNMGGKNLPGLLAALPPLANNPSAMATEALNEVGIVYTGFKPTDGSNWWFNPSGGAYEGGGLGSIFAAIGELVHWGVKEYAPEINRELRAATRGLIEV